jgi:hypothetical protein
MVQITDSDIVSADRVSAQVQTIAIQEVRLY